MSIDELPLTLPPLFAEACGYRGSARYVALCWVPEKGELWWSDDGYATLGCAAAFQMLCEHPATAPALEGYKGEQGTWEERRWLLIDRYRRRLSLSEPGKVWSIIESQFSGRPPTRGRVHDDLMQQQLERHVAAWLDWAAKRMGLD